MLLVLVRKFYINAEFYKLAYVKEKKDHQKTREKNMQYKSEAAFYKQKYLEIRRLQSVCSIPQTHHPDTLDAVRYAMIKSHPDNGGKKEDFVRFSDCYNNLKNNAKK